MNKPTRLAAGQSIAQYRALVKAHGELGQRFIIARDKREHQIFNRIARANGIL